MTFSKNIFSFAGINYPTTFTFYKPGKPNQKQL